jgi:hypothetical protein
MKFRYHFKNILDREACKGRENVFEKYGSFFDLFDERDY